LVKLNFLVFIIVLIDLELFVHLHRVVYLLDPEYGRSELDFEVNGKPPADSLLVRLPYFCFFIAPFVG